MDTQRDDRREFRAAELAERAGITLRTLRFYRERKLLPPPRLRGRTAWYDGHHLARLRAISALLDRGHTLTGIGELLTAFAAGRDAGRTAELLGLNTASPWEEEQRVWLSAADVAAYYGDDATAANLAAALEMGYLATEGAGVVHASRELLEATSAITKRGIPLAEILTAGRDMRGHIDALADLATGLIRSRVVPLALGQDREPGPLTAEERGLVAEQVRQIRPLLSKALHAEFALALDRALRAELDDQDDRWQGSTATP